MDKPYVVSADIYSLMSEWANRECFVLPSRNFFYQLREKFLTCMSRIFPSFDFVSEDEISQSLARLVSECGLPTVSLDRVYFKSELNLELTRLVDNEGNDCGLGHRAGSPSILKQVKRLQMSGVREVAIVDDVIFTGVLLERVIDLLSRIKIRVPLIYAGIGIAEGINRINGTRRKVYCVRTYEEVIDEVCERDFYPGVPLSGRLLFGGNNIGVPYLFPFGNPERWASIPSQHAVVFSKFCLHQTIALFEEVERCSNKLIFCQDLGRKVAGLPMNKMRYTDALRKIL